MMILCIGLEINFSLLRDATAVILAAIRMGTTCSTGYISSTSMYIPLQYLIL